MSCPLWPPRRFLKPLPRVPPSTSCASPTRRWWLSGRACRRCELTPLPLPFSLCDSGPSPSPWMVGCAWPVTPILTLSQQGLVSLPAVLTHGLTTMQHGGVVGKFAWQLPPSNECRSSMCCISQAALPVLRPRACAVVKLSRMSAGVSQSHTACMIPSHGPTILPGEF